MLRETVTSSRPDTSRTSGCASGMYSRRPVSNPAGAGSSSWGDQGPHAFGAVHR